MNRPYPKDTAGAHATAEVIIARPEETLGEIELRLHTEAPSLMMLQYIYVVNKENKLEGIVSMRNLFTSAAATAVREVMSPSIISVRPHSHREVAAVKAVKNNIRAVPVVEKDGTFVGVVTSDTILDILSEEHSKDLLYMGGVDNVYSASSLLKERLTVLLRARLPWLLVGLAGGLVAALIVEQYETILGDYIVLAFFLPLVVYMSDAVANQTLAVFIRAIALDHSFSIRRYILRELSLGAFIALVVGSLLTGIGLLWFEDVPVALVLGSALFLAVLVAVVIALSMALILVSLKKDPAVGSGPFATIIIDIVTIVIYLSIAAIFLPIVV
ncbi:MAG: magnesium transporter [Candidatus Paceibacterota bacterium]